jgi:hypothetical protein
MYSFPFSKPEYGKAVFMKARKINLDLDVRRKLHYPAEFTPAKRVSKPNTDIRFRL